MICVFRREVALPCSFVNSHNAMYQIGFMIGASRSSSHHITSHGLGPTLSTGKSLVRGQTQQNATDVIKTWLHPCSFQTKPPPPIELITKSCLYSSMRPSRLPLVLV